MRIKESVLDSMLEDLNRNFAIVKDASIEYVFRKHAMEFVKESLLRFALLQIQLLPRENSFAVVGDWEQRVFNYEEEADMKELNDLSTILSITTLQELKDDYRKRIKEKIDEMEKNGIKVVEMSCSGTYQFEDEFLHIYDLIPPPEIYTRLH